MGRGTAQRQTPHSERCLFHLLLVTRSGCVNSSLHFAPWMQNENIPVSLLLGELNELIHVMCIEQCLAQNESSKILAMM